MTKIIKTAIVTIVVIAGLSAQGWHESFSTDGTIDADGIFGSDHSWQWWSSGGTPTITDGELSLTVPTGSWDLLEQFTGEREDVNFISIDETSDTNITITPYEFEVYIKTKFTNSVAPSDEDQLFITLAADVDWLGGATGSPNFNAMTIMAIPFYGWTGAYHMATAAWDPIIESPAVAYDTYFWHRIVVDSSDISVWVYTDGEVPGESADFTFTIDISDRLDQFIIAIGCDIDNGTGYVSEVYYNESPSLAVEQDITIAEEYSLDQNYPNPFNPETNIHFRIPNDGHVNLKVYNLKGEEIATLINRRKNAGNHTIVWNASNVPSGLYLYQLKTGSFVQTKKMALIK